MARREIKSESAGTVWKVEVPEGGRCEQGDTILVVECMKMEIPVVAPAGGTVLEVRVAEKDAIEDGQVLVVFETA